MGSTIVVIIALSALGYVAVYLLLNARLRRAVSPEAQIRGLREEVDRLVVELNQTTDRNLALLEDKMAELSDALAKADRRIGLIKRESGKQEEGARVYSRIAEARPATQRPAAPEAAAVPGGALRDLRAEVMALHRSGLPAALISSRVGAPLGEVELVISLESREASRGS